MSEQAYPLAWPAGWARKLSYQRAHARFGARGRGASMTSALDLLEAELRRLGATHPVTSTSVQRRLDGRPYANQAKPSDPGAAVYFTLKKRRLVLACDKWIRVEDNLHAIALHIESMRGQERWGVGSLEQAFAGYTALPAPTGADCWSVLGLLPAAATVEKVDAAYREKAFQAHPDRGGSHEAFIALQQARDTALATLQHR